MASNTFGQLFRITTWGESHGKAIGVVIDGCPAGVALNIEDIQLALALRAPGRNAFTSPRQETDEAEIYSGVFEGYTTGAPISIIIMNRDVNSSHYTALKEVLRPGHANFTYLQKYGGTYDHRGGGRASARETACRVAAAAVAKKILQHEGIQTCAYLSTVGAIHAPDLGYTIQDLAPAIESSPIFCPHVSTAQAMQNVISHAIEAGDSIGGIVTFLATDLPVGLGDPVYEKLEANLAKAMLSIPASKGFEIGEGFHAAQMSGSDHNDVFMQSGQQISMQTNYAGGTLGGISSGMPLMGRVAFKPTSSIRKAQQTVDLEGNATVMTLPEGSRHDPCVAIRAVPVVDAMCALVLVDALLMQRCTRLMER